MLFVDNLSPSYQQTSHTKILVITNHLVAQIKHSRTIKPGRHYYKKGNLGVTSKSTLHPTKRTQMTYQRKRNHSDFCHLVEAQRDSQGADVMNNGSRLKQLAQKHQLPAMTNIKEIINKTLQAFTRSTEKKKDALVIKQSKKLFLSNHASNSAFSLPLFFFSLILMCTYTELYTTKALHTELLIQVKHFKLTLLTPA
jgi:hypothetical protein